MLLQKYFICRICINYRDHFYQFGEIENIHVISKQNCAFITYTTRPAAEKAVEESFNKLIIKGNFHSVLCFKSILPDKI